MDVCMCVYTDTHVEVYLNLININGMEYAIYKS